MSHLSAEQLTNAYYGESHSSVREHLQQCHQCAEEYAHLEELLHAVRNTPAPEPEAGYENEVWRKLLSQLPQRQSSPFLFLRPWLFAPALALMLALSFLAGMLTQQRRQFTGISAQARERVLLISLSDHLERSQVLLTELLNASPAALDLASQRSQARDLLEENRLLRQASARAGESARSATLDDLERVLLDVANSPADLSADDLQILRTRIKNDGLLFKVRITGADARRQGQEL